MRLKWLRIGLLAAYLGGLMALLGAGPRQGELPPFPNNYGGKVFIGGGSRRLMGWRSSPGSTPTSRTSPARG